MTTTRAAALSRTTQPLLASAMVCIMPFTALAEVVPSLPLQRGFYVDSRATCASASNATLVLLTRNGLNVARAISKFQKIDRVGPTTYAVTTIATDLDGRAIGSPETVSYELPSATTFRVKNPGGVLEFRFCTQSSLPPPWRNNDIGDLIR